MFNFSPASRQRRGGENVFSSKSLELGLISSIFFEIFRSVAFFKCGVQGLEEEGRQCWKHKMSDEFHHTLIFHIFYSIFSAKIRPGFHLSHEISPH